MNSYVRTTLEGYISTHVDIISALYKQEKDWLRPREKEFLVHNLVLRFYGHDIKSQESVEELRRRMGFSSRDDVYTYRNKLKAKGWLEQTKEDIVFPEVLDVFRDPGTQKLNRQLSYRFNLKFVGDINSE